MSLDFLGLIHSQTRFVRLWLLACFLGLMAFVLVLAAVDGDAKTFANLANQVLVNALLGGLGCAAGLAVGRRRWAPWLLVLLLALLFAASATIWHRTPPLPE